MGPTKPGGHTVPEVQLERSLGKGFLSAAPSGHAVSDPASAWPAAGRQLPARRGRVWGALGTGSFLWVLGRRDPLPTAAAVGATPAGGHLGAVGHRAERACSRQPGARLAAGSGGTRVSVTGTGLRAISSGRPESATLAARSWGARPPGELEGRWAEWRGLEPRTREPSGGRDRGRLLAQVAYSTGGEF